MSAKSDVFDVPRVEPRGEEAFRVRVPWSRHSPAPRRTREFNARDEWPAEERTTARLKIPALEDEVYEDGDDAVSLPVHRAPRASSPDIPVAAQQLLREPAFAEASVDQPLDDFDDEPSAEVNATIARLLGADDSLDEDYACGEGDAGDPELQLELQIELEADSADGEDAAPEGDEGDEAFEAAGRYGASYDDRDDPDVLCSNGVAHVERSSDEGEGYERGGDAALRREARDRDETDEDANWWMRVDTSSIDQLPLPQELELDDLPDAHAAGVISGTAGGPTLQQRLLTVLDSPTEIECSCGHDCDQREEVLREMFRELSAAESRTLHLRLSLMRHEDSLAMAFAALPRQHRARLLDFLDKHARRRVIEGANWRVIRNP